MAFVTAMLVAAIVFIVAAYAEYFRDIKNEVIAPNRWSWLIWSAATAVEAFTYEAVSEDWMKSVIFFISASETFLFFDEYSRSALDSSRYEPE